MNKWIVPVSQTGRLALLAIVLFFPVFILSQSIIIVPTEIPETSSFFNEPVTAILTIIAWLLGTFALTAGIFSVIKQKERAITVFAAIILGGFVFIFGAGEVLFPH